MVPLSTAWAYLFLRFLCCRAPPHAQTHANPQGQSPLFQCNHGLYLTVANVIASGTVGFLPLISDVVEEALMRWLRAAELTCDRAALLVAQDKKVRADCRCYM